MNLKDRILQKSNLWHLGAIVLFLVIACGYFSPALKGYRIEQADIVNFSGMSREVVDFRQNSDEQILWTNSMFSGMPTDQISRKYEGTWLAEGLTELIRFGLPTPIFFLFIYFISFYILALSLRMKPITGIIGSVAFGLSSYFIVILEAGHNSKAAAIGLAPLMIAGFILAYRKKNWILGVALASIFMMVELAANHVQITYYMAIIMVLMGIVELLRHVKENQLPKFFKVTGALALGYVLAVMVNYGNLFGTLDYAKQTIRGGTELTINADGTPNDKNTTSGLDRDYVTNWSYGHAETFSFFVPNYKGGETQAIGQNEANDDILKEFRGTNYAQNIAGSNQYWGDQPFTSGPVYLGIIVLFLAFLGLVYSKDKYKWGLLSAALLAVALSWGKNYVSAFILLPILLYNVNIFLEGKKQLIFTGVNTLLFLFALGGGDAIVSASLTDFFLDAVPGYNKFRAVTIVLVVVELCVPLLGLLFLQRLFKSREEIKENLNGFFIVSGVFLIFLLGLLMMPTSFNTFISAQEMAQLESISDPNFMAQYVDFYDNLEIARIEIFKKDVLRSLGFFVFGAGILFAFIQVGFNKYILGSGLTLFILLDLIWVDQRYLNNDGTGKKYAQWVESYEMLYPFAAGDGEKQILAIESAKNPMLTAKIDSALQALNTDLKDEDASAREKQVRRDFLTYRIMNRYTNFRVFEVGNPFNSSYTSYFNKSIGGYHGAKLSRYQDLIDFHLSKANPAVIDMLNTQYFLQPLRDNTGKISNSKLTQVNRGALGNAWFVEEVKWVENPNDEILALDAYNATVITNKGAGQVLVNGQAVQNAELIGNEQVAVLLPGMQEAQPITNIPYGALADQSLALVVDSAGFNWILDSAPDSLFAKVFSLEAGGRGGWNPEKVAVMDKRFEGNATGAYSGEGSIEMTSYHPDRMVYKSSSNAAQLAVFSEIYYEGGWTVSIDGQETDKLARANYVLRALELPAGEHEIVFEYSSPVFEKAKTIALIGSFAILLLLAAGIYLELKADNTEEEAVTNA